MRRFVCALTLLAFIFLLCSCDSREKSCEELLTVGVEYGIENYRDNGYVFLKKAEQGELFFFSEKNKKTVYGERFLEVVDKSEDFAIYFSASAPYEIAVFKSDSRNLNSELIKMLYERADEKKIALRFTEWERGGRDIKISAYGKYVLFIFTDSKERNEGVEQELYRMLKD